MTNTTIPGLLLTTADELRDAMRPLLVELYASAFAEGQRSTLPRMLNVAAASRWFGVSRERIEGWIAGGQLESTRIGNRIFVRTAQMVALTEGKPKRTTKRKQVSA